MEQHNIHLSWLVTFFLPYFSPGSPIKINNTSLLYERPGQGRNHIFFNYRKKNIQFNMTNRIYFNTVDSIKVFFAELFG